MAMILSFNLCSVIKAEDLFDSQFQRSLGVVALTTLGRKNKEEIQTQCNHEGHTPSNVLFFFFQISHTC